MPGRAKSKGIIMETICQPKKIVNIIAEADELISQLNSGRIEDMEETQRT
jgi:hypothetical protein